MIARQILIEDKLNNGYEEQHPLYVNNETIKELLEKFSDMTYEFYSLCSNKEWKDLSALLREKNRKRAIQLLNIEPNASFIIFGLINDDVLLEKCLEYWQRVQKANEKNLEFKWKQIIELDKFYGREKVDLSLEKELSTFQLIFNFNIPLELKEILFGLLEKKWLDYAYVNELNIAKDIGYLYSSFKDRFQRIPHIFPMLITSIDVLNVPLVVKEFNVKSMRYALSLEKEIGGSEFHPIYLSLAFGKQVQTVVSKLKKYKRDMYGFIGGLPIKVPFSDLELKNWVISYMGATKTEIIHDVCKFWNEPGFPRNSSLKEMTSYLSKNRASKEWDLCREKYPGAFKKPFERLLEDKPYTCGNERVRLLEANDKLQVLLGSLTVCCQQLNHSGEASMMEGLVNPHSGFVVFERGHKVLAQAWVWLSEDGNQYVLDNIELADQREPIEILDLLCNWVEGLPYPNVMMGVGYNKVLIGKEVKEEEMKWYKKMWNYKYTDADNRVWLKKDGKMIIFWGEEDEVENE